MIKNWTVHISQSFIGRRAPDTLVKVPSRGLLDRRFSHLSKRHCQIDDGHLIDKYRGLVSANAVWITATQGFKNILELRHCYKFLPDKEMISFSTISICGLFPGNEAWKPRSRHYLAQFPRLNPCQEANDFSPSVPCQLSPLTLNTVHFSVTKKEAGFIDET